MPGVEAGALAGMVVEGNHRTLVLSKKEKTMDPRWQHLPHTDTEFVPAVYPDRESWEKEKARLREQLLFAAGLWPLPEKPPLASRIWHRLERDGYTVEKVWFQSLPGFYVGGNLYRPLDPGPQSHPGILHAHGHGPIGRLGETEVASYQARCLTLARLGCVSFIWDMVDYNDSARHLSGAYEAENYSAAHRLPWPYAHAGRKLWSVNILGLQLWNSIRALDFLLSLPEVDPNRLACTGESGGGTQTYNLYAVDDRLHAAAPVCMVSAYMQGGCGCENAPCLRLETNNVDIGATLAPRPLLLVNSAQDWTRHTPEVEYPAIKRIYELYGAGERVAQVQIDSPHGYNKAMREAVYRWFARWFGLPCGEDFVEPAYRPERPEDLLAFVDGLPEGAIVDHETLVEQRVEAARRALRGYFPDTAEKLGQNRRIFGRGLGLAIGWDQSGAVYRRARARRVSGLSCEEGTIIGDRRGVQIPVRIFHAGQPVQTLLIHPQGMNAVYASLVRALGQHTVLAIDPFGRGGHVGEQNPEQPRGSTKFFDTFNRTDLAERVYDIALTIRYLLEAGAQKLNVVGFGEAGLWALLAGGALGLAGRTLRWAIDADGFDTASEADYLTRLPLPGILRLGGLPHVAALLAPHELLLHNTSGVFDVSWAAAAYALGPPTAFTVHEHRLKNEELIAYLNQ